MNDVLLARTQSLGDIPRRTAARFPHKEALIDGDMRLTFTDFEAHVERVASALAALGLVKGDRLAIISTNCWQFPVLTFAAARLGVIFIPINFMLGPAEIAYILDHSDPKGIVCGATSIDAATAALEIATPTIPLRAVIRNDGDALLDGWTDFAEWIERPPTEYFQPHINDDDPLRLMYTSGTESRPKGAMLSSRSLMWQYTSCISSGGMASSDIEVHTLPLYHCAQLDNFLITDIYLGATSVILPGPDPERVLATIQAERVTNYFGPPTVWISLLRSPAFDATDLGTLRKGYYGASAMPVEILKEMGKRLPQVSLWNFYGQTEMASLATVLGPEDQLTRGGSAGRPALNVETRIVNEFDNVVRSGVLGEIVHRSPQATLGYYKDPEKTAAAFKSGWFHSGDLGVLDDEGYLTVVDRKKDMIKSGGENVASREVEEVIYEHPGVAEVAVFGVSHPRWIESVAAVVVPREGESLSETEIIAFCRERLAGYKTPKSVTIVDALPKNPSGKILKRQLRDAYGNLPDNSTEAPL